jgi:tetratricopeptide (TPR) repeat protein
MNKSAFLKLIQQASSITDQQQDELEKVAAAFPYCQTAHLLLAKSAYDKGSMLSTQRLRRASAYATDRQLLKRIIYTAPVLEPVYADEEETLVQDEELLTNEPEVEKESLTEPEISNFPLIEDGPGIDDTFETEIEQKLEDVYTPASMATDLYPNDSSDDLTEDKAPEAEIDSELALLFTFSSISSSSTDLLNERSSTDEEEETVDFSIATAPNHLAETAEALGNIEEFTPISEEINEQPTEDEGIEEEETIVEAEAEILSEGSAVEHSVIADTEADFFAEEEETVSSQHEDAEINYSFDEIDRLYAEDSLGYWMGSSRMGEVLQLKDDYTRQKPQSFHPELILEYSRTHELKKAIQPTANVLSHQLNIIDQFLKLNPRLKTMASLKLKPEPQEDLSLKSSKIKKGMASESLASIFLKQGKTKKALKIYEQLILKYPEKKSYFAEQIEKLQNIT